MNLKTPVCVTRTDINQGERKNPRNCPVVRAIRRRLLPEFQPVIDPDGGRSYITKFGSRHSLFNLSLPVCVRLFVARFDSDRIRKSRLYPFDFHITIPVRFLRSKA